MLLASNFVTRHDRLPRLYGAHDQLQIQQEIAVADILDIHDHSFVKADGVPVFTGLPVTVSLVRLDGDSSLAGIHNDVWHRRSSADVIIYDFHVYILLYYYT